MIKWMNTGSAAVSEKALWYGIKMLERSGGGLKDAIKTDNQFERRLLAEVSGSISTSSCGHTHANIHDSLFSS